MNAKLFYVPYSYVLEGTQANQIQSLQNFRAFTNTSDDIVGIFPTTTPHKNEGHACYVLMKPSKIGILGQAAKFAWHAYWQYIRRDRARSNILCRDFTVAWVFVLLRQLRLPGLGSIVLEVHDLLNYKVRWKYKAQEIIIEWLVRYTLQHVDSIISTTSATKQVLLDKYKLQQTIHVISNGHNIDQPSQPSLPEEVPSDSFVVGYAGLTYSRHSVETLLDSLSHLDDSIKVYLAGGEAKEIETLKQKYPGDFQTGRIKHFGRLAHDEMPGFYSRLNTAVHLLPNDFEANIFRSSLKIFEYMALGLPIIAADVQSTREILNENNAVFYTPLEPRSLAEAIETLHHDPALMKRISSQAYRDAGKYHLKERAKKILSVCGLHQPYHS